MELIPNLPDDVARECLLRTSYKQFPTIASVCRGWNREVSLSDFLQQRKASRHSQELLILSQAEARRHDKDSAGSLRIHASPVYRIAVLESGSGLWTELPPLPGGQSNGLPLFCSLVSVGPDLIVLGGLDPVTWQASDSVFVFSFLTSKWRVGTTMPGVRRSFFGCASDSDRTVLVAGGHDEEKSALTSAIVYDVAEDKWTFLPDMARERDECKATFHAGRFHVIGGYATEEQGQFGKTSESFDVSTWQWGPLTEDGFLDDAVSPPICAAGENGDLYACWRGDVMVFTNDTWKKVGQIPSDVHNVTYVAVRPGKLVVIGSGKAGYGEATVGYICDLSSSRWVQLEIHVGHVQAGCFLQV
ncbi:PREDICTED: F-box/kelch-repeat protein At1g80440-like [Camelina sativa]|uniref:F-box/kelch-repeat protein At1g80440-like n=1 Tax=Camelina sativa TaxID=90675 RepID=A0ABM0SXV7_CAMSA|nr:PREDICTED: F-box/kelch-repeat protein At1g80440-like [Camelina sativa]